MSLILDIADSVQNHNVFVANALEILKKSMAKYKTAVSPLLAPWDSAALHWATDMTHT